MSKCFFKQKFPLVSDNDSSLEPSFPGAHIHIKHEAFSRFIRSWELRNQSINICNQITFFLSICFLKINKTSLPLEFIILTLLFAASISRPIRDILNGMQKHRMHIIWCTKCLSIIPPCIDYSFCAILALPLRILINQHGFDTVLKFSDNN